MHLYNRVVPCNVAKRSVSFGHRAPFVELLSHATGVHHHFQAISFRISPQVLPAHGASSPYSNYHKKCQLIPCQRDKPLSSSLRSQYLRVTKVQ